MVTIKRFALTNFRGAKNVRLPINDGIDRRVITLIGLNESGKTTVLEGISLFPIKDKAAASMYKSLPTSQIEQSMVPIHQTGIFTGKVTVSADFELDHEDWAGLTSHIKSLGYELDQKTPIQSITITKSFEFSGGDYVKPKFGSTWGGVDLLVRKNKKSALRRAEANLPFKGDDFSLWNSAVDYLEARVPHVVYLPSFLVDVPRKIYLEKFEKEDPTNAYYRRIIDYALRETGENISLQSHIIDRISRYKSNKLPGTWISTFMSSDERDKVDAVFSHLGAVLTKEVIGSWSKVFNRPVAATRVDIRWSIDPANERPYVEIRVSDGRSPYHLHQRSLGFRWFFSFLLFTKFGRDRSRQNVFLFDEPAANLHAKAQVELLNSFAHLASEGDIVIYSTHSHHMIQPEWLSGAFIVENEAIDYDDEQGERFSPKDTDIKLYTYRRFVGEHGNRVSYFQPVIERLQYVSPRIMSGAPKVLVEGPSDFFALTYALRRSKHKDKLVFVPGTGSGSLNTLISLCLGQGETFFTLLDDDIAGRKSAQRYKEVLFLSSAEVGTIADLLPKRIGAQLESFISEDTKEIIASVYGKYNKRTAGQYFAESCALNKDEALSAHTLQGFLELIEELAKQLRV